MKNKNKFINIIAFSLYIILILVMFCHHENWRDEAQAFLLCRDMNLIELFKNIPYEGHPILYYLFLFPLVRLGVGPKSVNILSFAFMSVSVYLILFKSRLSFIQKISIIISYPVLYEFSIVGRSYSLVFLLLIAYGLLYSDRKKHPILFAIVLGCLLNTHLLMVGFVGINTFLFYFIEIIKNKKRVDKGIIIGFIILLLFALILFIQFCPYLLVRDTMSVASKHNFLSFLYLLFMLLFGSVGLFNMTIVGISIILLIIVYFYFFIKDKFIFIILFTSYLFMALLMTYVFNGLAIYTLSLALSVLFSAFLAVNNDKKSIALLVCISLLSLPIVINSYYLDYNYNYSSAYETSKYIKNNIAEDGVLICNNDSLCSSIIPYVDNKFYSTKTNKYFTYVKWNKDREGKVDINTLKQYIDSCSSPYYIVSKYNYLEDMEILNELKSSYNIVELFSSYECVYADEYYYIYKLQ